MHHLFSELYTVQYFTRHLKINISTKVCTLNKPDLSFSTITKYFTLGKQTAGRCAKKIAQTKLVNRSTTHFIVDVKSTEITGFRRSTIAMRQRPLSTNESTNIKLTPCVHNSKAVATTVRIFTNIKFAIERGRFNHRLSDMLIIFKKKI